MPARLQFDFSPTPKPRPRDGQSPMRLLLLGDFSARPTAERRPLAERPTYRVDVDSLDDVMQRLSPRLQLAGTEVGFETLDDFHPDALFARVPVFASLRQMRQRLMDPARFAQAAAELGSVAAPTAGAPAAAGNSGDLLAGLLGGRPAAAAPVAPAAQAVAGVDAFIRNIIAPHIVPDHRLQQAELVASVDSATAAEMRALLHDPTFQSLEAAWRGTQWLISSLELDETLELHLFDVSREELLADVVASQGQLARTGLHRALADRWRNVPGAHGWSAVTALCSFGPSDADIGLLAALGLLAAQAGGPLLAAGNPSLALGDAATLAGWQSLRLSEAAPFIGLAAPRVLLRLPYGKRSDPCSAFAFEEFPGSPEHSQFLWGAGSMAIALLLGRAYTQRGWAFEPGDEREIGDMPAYHYTRDGESEMQACAESYLGEEAGQALLAAGLMPVLSHKNRNAVTVMRFQSIAEPAAALAGLGAGRKGD
jgi:type VI secretion system protein ImpC